MAKLLRRAESLGSLVIVSVLLLALIVPSSMSVLGAPGDRVVKIGHHVALTGALASTYVHAAYGSFDCVRHINEQGTRWYQWCQVMS